MEETQDEEDRARLALALRLRAARAHRLRPIRRRWPPAMASPWAAMAFGGHTAWRIAGSGRGLPF